MRIIRPCCEANLHQTKPRRDFDEEDDRSVAFRRSALPNAGANTWPVSNGMYIDWYYTAAYGMDFGYSMFG